MNKIAMIFAGLITCTNVNAQTCNNQMTPSIKTGQFIDNGDSTVSDAVNLLMWDQCSYGQTYSDGQCLGAPTQFDTWKEALVVANSIEGKYLPNLKELAILVERACFKPSISREAFPDTPLAMYWTNTPDGSAGPGDPIGRLIDFTDGGEIIRDVNRPKYIRLLNIIVNK